jgi:hypothetical protein
MNVASSPPPKKSKKEETMWAHLWTKLHSSKIIIKWLCNKKEGCRKKTLLCRNTTLWNPNTINSNKLHHRSYIPDVINIPLLLQTW